MLVTEVFDRYKIYDLREPNKNINQVRDPVQLAEILKANSPTFVKAYVEGKYLLYRGVADASYIYNGYPIITGIRKNRKPVQMGAERAKALEKFFKKEGLKVTRQNSIFCTPKVSVAEGWGKSYIVFPKEPWIGLAFLDPEYRFTYSFYDSMRIADLVRTGNPTSIQTARTIFHGMKPTEFNSGNVAALLKTKSCYEVLIKGDSYIGLQTGAKFTKQVLSELKK